MYICINVRKLRKVFQDSLFYLIIAFLGSWVLVKLELLQSLFLFKAFNFSDILLLTPIQILIGILIVDVSFLKLLKRTTVLPMNLPTDSKNIKKLLSSLFNYFLVGLFSICTIVIIKLIYSNVDLNFQVEALFEITIIEIFWFFVFLNIFIANLIISIFLMQKIRRYKLDNSYKIKLIFSIIILFAFISFFLFDYYFLIPAVLSFLIYIFVLDLFMDKINFNTTWIFTLMILVAGLTSLIIFSSYSEQINNKRIQAISSLIFDRSGIHEKSILNDIPGELPLENIILEKDTIPQKEMLNRLNNGFYSLNDSLFFNPRNGNYIYLIAAYDSTDLIIKTLYNTIEKSTYSSLKSKNKFKYIMLYKQQILYNNTGYDKIPIPDNIVFKDSISEYFVDGLSFLRYQYNDDLILFQIERVPSILRPFSLFSMLFVLTGAIFFLISVINSKLNFLPEIIKISFKGVVTLRDRIQISIIGLLIVSFFILGVITFYYIHNISSEYQKKEALVHSMSFFNELNKEDSVLSTDLILDKLLHDDDNSDAILYYYNKDGNLEVDPRRKIDTTSSLPFKNLDIESKLAKEKYEQNHYLINDKNLLYSIIPLKLGDESKGYIVSYYFNNDSVLAASDILSNFLNVYVLLFLVAGAIAIALANSISKPIEILGEKLEILNLSEKNGELKWDNKDEIGKLISIYNKTVKKLEESAKIITKIERDSAWKEMAKQVAHEIKNPLTPLKLNIQYLQGIVGTAPERAGDMVKQLAPGLIEQINNLDKIATEFSDFAKMPTASNEKVKLNEIVKVVHDFFRKREDLDIQLYVPINDLVVFADKNHIVSILNNILKNAIQAIPTDREGKIVIELYKEKDNAIIKVNDNGSGISDEMKNKVFSPNFTTKSSGTGLGLAISSNMIQAFNGKIYFDTIVDEGTTFFIEIPLMRIKENYNDQRRVSLDD